MENTTPGVTTVYDEKGDILSVGIGFNINNA